MEIERKFLVAVPPPELRRASGKEIQQGYIAIEQAGREVRLRGPESDWSLTVKHGRGLLREEIEIRITADQFDSLWPLTAGRRVEKTRFVLAIGSHSIEVDVYGGRHKGLVVAEVEFASEVESALFDPPHWFGREVTDDATFSNQRLAVAAKSSPKD